MLKVSPFGLYQYNVYFSTWLPSSGNWIKVYRISVMGIFQGVIFQKINLYVFTPVIFLSILSNIFKPVPILEIVIDSFIGTHHEIWCVIYLIMHHDIGIKLWPPPPPLFILDKISVPYLLHFIFKGKVRRQSHFLPLHPPAMIN